MIVVDKEDHSTQLKDFPSTENESKKTLSFKKVTRSLRRYKTRRNNMRPDFASEMKYNYKYVHKLLV